MFESLLIRYYEFVEGYTNARTTARIAKEFRRSAGKNMPVPFEVSGPIVVHQTNCVPNSWYREGAELYYGLHAGDAFVFEEMLKGLRVAATRSFLSDKIRKV